jgi:integrase
MATLTDTKIRKAKEGILADESSPGLRLYVGKTKKTWIYRFRDKRTKKLEQVTLGYYPKMGLAAARLQWAELRVARDQGANVQREHRHQQEGSFTVQKLCDLYVNGYAIKIKRSWREDSRMLDKDICSLWGDTPASDIRRADVIELLTGMVPRGERGAQLLLAAARKAWNFAIDQERVAVNPFARLKVVKGVVMSADTRVHIEKPKPRCLDDRELKKLLTKLPDSPMKDSTKDILLLQLLTASRKGEVCEIQWAEVDTRKKIWTLPAEKAKNKQEHKVMLSQQALDIIKAQPRTNDYVFYSRASCGHVRGDSVNETLARAQKHFKLKHFTPHALRHSALTGLSALGCSREIQNRISNHRDSTMGGLYDQNPRDKEAREWLQKWADHLDSLIVDNVVPISGRG